MKITPEKRKELDERTLLNIVEKVAAGGVPTARESALIAEATEAPRIARGKRIKYKRTSREYAQIYRCAERSIKRYRQANAPLDDPAAMAEVFAAQKNKPAGVRNLAAGGALPFNDDDNDDVTTAADYDAEGKPLSPAAKLNNAKLEKVVLECQRLAFRLDVEKGRYILRGEVTEIHQRLLGELKGEFRKAFESEAPPKCEGLPAPEIQRVLRETLDSVLSRLSRDVDSLAEDEPQLASEPV